MPENLQSLVNQVALGDQKAFHIIFDQYSHKVYVFALKLTRSEIISEEIVQEVFIKIWSNRESLGHIEYFPSYLYTVTRNHTFNILKRIALEEKAKAVLAKRQSVVHEETEQNIIYQDYQNILEKVIDRLPPQQKLVYGLCRDEGLKYEEAAERLNISRFTVKTHMQQALKAIRLSFRAFAGLLLIIDLPF